MRISIKTASQTSGVKDEFVNKSVVIISLLKNKKPHLQVTPWIKILSRWDQWFKVNNKAMKVLDENMTELINK